MRVAIDTNRYADLCRGELAVIELLESSPAVLLPFVVLGELRAGFATGSRGRHNERVLNRFLLRDGVEVLYADDRTTRHYAAVFRQLRAQGTPIPTNDMWIAALTVQHDLALCTRDRHFEHLPQIMRV